jgi:hypothetical protein
MICFHGYGDNYKIASLLKHLKCVEATLVSFNFPEYDIKKGREITEKLPLAQLMSFYLLYMFSNRL